MLTLKSTRYASRDRHPPSQHVEVVQREVSQCNVLQRDDCHGIDCDDLLLPDVAAASTAAALPSKPSSHEVWRKRASERLLALC